MPTLARATRRRARQPGPSRSVRRRRSRLQVLEQRGLVVKHPMVVKRQVGSTHLVLGRKVKAAAA